MGAGKDTKMVHEFGPDWSAEIIDARKCLKEAEDALRLRDHNRAIDRLAQCAKHVQAMAMWVRNAR